jgi:hypothetical protein
MAVADFSNLRRNAMTSTGADAVAPGRDRESCRFPDPLELVLLGQSGPDRETMLWSRHVTAPFQPFAGLDVLDFE